MSDQYYRLERSTAESDWPLEFSEAIVHDLNAVAPRGYHYALVDNGDGSEPHIELYEYMGEYDTIAEDSDDAN